MSLAAAAFARAFPGLSVEEVLLLREGTAWRHFPANDPARFAARWREIAHETRFDELNELIRQHNTWYPVERDLPMNPRTGEYVLQHGRDFRRDELTAAWVLEQFPAKLQS